MAKNKKEINSQIDESSLFAQVTEIIASRKLRAGAYTNREVTLMFWGGRTVYKFDTARK